MNRANELGFLDDRRFADSVVRGLTNGRGLGRRRVAMELSTKGVEETLAAELLDEYCSEELERERATFMAEKFTRSRPLDKAKLASRLVAKGYATSLAFDVADRSCTARKLREEASEES